MASTYIQSEIDNLTKQINSLGSSPLNAARVFALKKELLGYQNQLQSSSPISQIATSKVEPVAQPAQTTPIAQVDPAAKAAPQPVAQPAANAANQQFLSQANKSYFTNFDPKTGLPVLNQKNLDAVLSKYGSNELTSSQYRDNYNAFGWNVKSDSSSVKNGAAVYGLSEKTTGVGMGGGGTKQYYKPGTTTLATDADFQKAADAAGVDISKYYSTKSMLGGAPKGTLDKTAAYNAIQDKTKDLYLVSNALDRTGIGANKAAPHASVLFKSDGSGNLVPVTNANGDVAANYYSGVGVTHEGWQGQLADLTPFAMVASITVPGIMQALQAANVAPATLAAAEAATQSFPISVAASDVAGATLPAISNELAASLAPALGLTADQVMAMAPEELANEIVSASELGSQTFPATAVVSDVAGATVPGIQGSTSLADIVSKLGGSAANALGFGTPANTAEALANAQKLGLIGSAGQALASYLGASGQTDAAKQAAANQLAMFNTINQQYAPYRGAGYQSLNQIRSMLPGQYTTYNEAGQPTGTATGTDYLTHQFTPQDLYAGLAPNYQFQLQQGQMANQRAANVGGGALSGNTLAGLERYTQDYAGNAYQQAFNNYQGQRTNIYNTLAGIAGIGQAAQGTTAQAGQAATNAAGQLGIGSAAANAAGNVGAANAIAGGLQNYQANQILQQILSQNQNVAQQGK